MSSTPTLTREQVLADAVAIAAGQAGGALATVHADDATPYVTYVLFHLRDNGEVLFGSMAKPQHARNLDATRECSFLIDNRSVVGTDATKFARIVVEGLAEHVEPDRDEYAGLLEELRGKSAMAAQFTEIGRLYRIVPRRIVSMVGYESTKHIVDFSED